MTMLGADCSDCCGRSLCDLDYRDARPIMAISGAGVPFLRQVTQTWRNIWTAVVRTQKISIYCPCNDLVGTYLAPTPQDRGTYNRYEWPGTEHYMDLYHSPTATGGGSHYFLRVAGVAAWIRLDAKDSDKNTDEPQHYDEAWFQSKPSFPDPGIGFSVYRQELIGQRITRSYISNCVAGVLTNYPPYPAFPSAVVDISGPGDDWSLVSSVTVAERGSIDIAVSSMRLDNAP